MNGNFELSSQLSVGEITDDVRNAEAAAAKALKNIQTLYDEIMKPNTSSDAEVDYTSYQCTNSSPTISAGRINTRTSSCVVSSENKFTSESDLCKKCHRQISSISSPQISSETSHGSRKHQSNAALMNNKCFSFETMRQTSRTEYKVTVPKPFELTKENIKRQEARELKLAKLKDELNKQIEEEINVKFSSKPVPKHVQLPLYKEMVERCTKRKTERRTQCSKIVNNIKNDTTLTKNVSSIVSKSNPDLTTVKLKSFKAKPVPKNILSENVSKKLKNKEEIRKILSAQRAQKLLDESSLPFSPRRIPRSQSWLNISDCHENNMAASKETIDAITKRLYTIKCKEAIENWNNKVVENSINAFGNASNSVKSDNNSKNRNLFPFYYYPVRKTSTTIKRENKIRSEIVSRDERKQKDDLILLDISKRNKNIFLKIWPRVKMNEPSLESDKEIEEKIKNFKASLRSREKEYEKELEEMMGRVSKQVLLIEKQSKEKKETPKSDTNIKAQPLSETDTSKSITNTLDSEAASEKYDEETSASEI